MTKEQAGKRIKELSHELDEHNYKYYVQSNPTISDYEFDKLLEELISLEKQFPEFLSPHSPSQRVGGAITKDFATVVHKYPMMSLGNTYSEEELRDFDQRVRKILSDEKIEYVCELKFDGVAIGLTYKDGELVRAVTRGDGVQGDDVTANVKTIRSIPLKLKKGDFPAEFVIRGEIILPRKEFDRMNAELAAQLTEDGFSDDEINERLYRNPRNTASGTLKQQDSAIVATRNLDCFLYALYGDNFSFKTHFESLDKAREWGFKVSDKVCLCSNLKVVMQYINEWEHKREKLGFEIDGVVIKVNNYRQQQELGFTSKVPRWAIAYKYKAEAAATVLNNIGYQVGRTGAITPVAHLKPVTLAGTVVKRASLHNADQIEKLDLRIGDTVFVEKGGEIIPKITAVDLSKRPAHAAKVKYITHCPECNTELIRNEGEANHYCPNENGCPPQIVGRLIHFTSRKAMNIEGLGGETVDLLFREGLVHNIADIYDLKKEQIMGLERMGDKSAGNIIEGINKSKEIAFERVLYAIGIRYVGDTVARKLARHFKNIDALMNANFEQLIEAPEIGEKIAESVLKHFADDEKRKVVERLKLAGLQFEIKQDASNQTLSDKLKGITIVVTGTFKNYERDQLKKLIEQHGGKNGSSVTGKTNYLLAGDDCGPSKLEKAEKMKVKVISEEQFDEMIS